MEEEMKRTLSFRGIVGSVFSFIDRYNLNVKRVSKCSTCLATAEVDFFTAEPSGSPMKVYSDNDGLGISVLNS